MPQNPSVQPGQPATGAQVVQPQAAGGTQIMQTSMGQLTALGKSIFCGDCVLMMSFSATINSE